jgi:hypothetical protein
LLTIGSFLALAEQDFLVAALQNLIFQCKANARDAPLGDNRLPLYQSGPPINMQCNKTANAGSIEIVMGVMG